MPRPASASLASQPDHRARRVITIEVRRPEEFYRLSTNKQTDGGLDGTTVQKRYDDWTLVRVSIHATSAPSYPSGWKYALHFGVLDPDRYPGLTFDQAGTIRRYDNTHERTKGHELHLLGRAEPIPITFPGMRVLLERFWRKIPPERIV